MSETVRPKPADEAEWHDFLYPNQVLGTMVANLVTRELQGHDSSIDEELLEFLSLKASKRLDQLNRRRQQAGLPSISLEQLTGDAGLKLKQDKFTD